MNKRQYYVMHAFFFIEKEILVQKNIFGGLSRGLGTGVTFAKHVINFLNLCYFLLDHCSYFSFYT